MPLRLQYINALLLDMITDSKSVQHVDGSNVLQPFRMAVQHCSVDVSPSYSYRKLTITRMAHDAAFVMDLRRDGILLLSVYARIRC